MQKSARRRIELDTKKIVWDMMTEKRFKKFKDQLKDKESNHPFIQLVSTKIFLKCDALSKAMVSILIYFNKNISSTHDPL
jgi:hypothetical protein